MSTDVLSASFYSEVAEAAIQRAASVHSQLPQAIQDSAIMRWFDLDLLAAFGLVDAPSTPPAGALLRSVQALHLVQPQPGASGRWQLLPELRTALLAQPAVQDQWLLLHARAAAVFRQRLETHPVTGDARFRDTGWRDLAVEWVYHLLHQDPAAGWHQVQLTCAQAFAIPTSGARWEVDFCVQFLSGLAWPPGISELDAHMAALKAGFADLAAYRDVQALPVVSSLADVAGLTAVEESGIRAWAGAVYLRDANNVAAALVWLEQAAVLTPADADVQFDLSEAYRTPGIWAGRFDLAERHARQALAVAPTADTGYLAMGYLAQALEDWTAAEDWFRQAVAANPDAIDGHLGLSEVAGARRDVDAALAYIDAAEAVNPGIRYYALIRRGHVYREAGRDAEAAHAYELARREAPDRTDAYVALGDLCFSQGRFSDAEAWYQQALHESPNDVEALVALAMLYAGDDTTRAIAVLEQALATGTRTKGVYYTLGNFYRNTGDITRVVEIQQTLVQMDAEEAYSAHCTTGRAFLDAAWRQPAGAEREKMLEQADAAFVAAQERDAQRAWSYVGLAEVAVLRNKPSAVEANLERLDQVAPWATYDGLVLIGQAYKDHATGPAAATLLQRATALKPDRTTAWQTLADLYDWLGNPAAVAQAWAQIVRCDPAQAYAAHLAVGDAYQRVGDEDRARAEYVAAAALHPERATAILRLAELDEASGRAREAVTEYQRTAGLAPGLTALANARTARLLLSDGDDAGAERTARAAIAANPHQFDGYVELARVGITRADDHLQHAAHDALVAATGDRLVYDFDLALGETYREAGLWTAAREQYATCLAHDPARVDAYVGMGLAWLAEGEYGDARQLLEQARGIDDRHVGVHAALSRLHHAQANVAGVYEAQAHIVALQPTLRYDAHLATGAACEVAAQYDQALAEYRAAIALAPWRPDAYASLAVLLRRAEQPHAAEQAYRQARELAGIAYADLAWFYQQQNRLADAEWVYRLGMAEEPTRLDAFAGLVDLLVVEERVPEAYALLDGMMERTELACDARLLRARLQVREGHHDEAAAGYREAIKRYPQRPEPYQELAALSIDRGDVEEAERVLRLAHTAIPEQAGFAWLLAQLAVEDGRDEAARRWYLKAGRLDPVDADASMAFQQAAEIALRQDRRRAAGQALQLAIERYPDNPGAHFLLGQLREQQNRLLPAAAAYERATAIAPKFGEAYRARGRIYGRLGDVDSLDAMAREVLALNPDEAYAAVIVVADAFRQASEYRRAEEAYRQAISLQPEQSEAMLYLASLLERQQRLAESAALYQQAAGHQDDPAAAADAWGQAGRVLAQMARYSAAETAFTTACTTDPDNPALHAALGELYEQLGDLDRAATQYDRARALNPNNADFYLALGRVAGQQGKPHKLAWVIRHVRALNLSAAYEYTRQLLIGDVYQAAGDLQRAEAAYRHVITGYSQPLGAYLRLIRLWVDQGRQTDALVLATSMLEQPGLVGAAWGALANLHQQLGDLAAAEHAYRQALAAEPRNADIYLDLARFYDANDRLADALVVLRQGIKAVPGHDDLMFALAERLSAQGQRNDALGLLQAAARFLRQDVEQSTIQVRIGDLWQQEGHLDRAEDAWRRALAADPDNAEACMRLGQQYERAGQIDQALAMYTRATMVAPKYRDAYVARGHILAARGDVSGITSMAQELAALFLDANETYQAHLLVANTYTEAGLYEAAARTLSAAVALAADNPEAHIQLGWVYEVQQQWSRARAEYERVGQLLPDLEPDVTLRVGQLYANEGNTSAAIQAFERGIELAPDEPDAYLGLAHFYETQVQFDAARATYARMLERGPAMAALAHQALGTFAERQGDTARAEEAYRQALALTPQDARAHLVLAGFYESTAQWDKAVDAYQQAADLDASQATNALLFVADIHRRQGRDMKMQVACDQVITLVDAMVSPDGDALRQRGLAYAMRGDFAAAAADLQQALAANPKDLQAHLYLAVTLTYLARQQEAESHLAAGIGLAQRKADLVYGLREVEVLAAHEPPIPGAAAVFERLQAARAQLP